MAVYSFDGAFRNLNNAMTGIGDAFEEERKRKAIAGIGAKLSAGDYSGAAQGLMAAGDVTNGLKAMELGHTRALQADAMRQAGQSFDLNSLGTGGGATLGSVGSGANAQTQAGGQTLANLGAGSPPRYNMNGAQPQFVAAEGTSPSQRFRGPQDFITAMTPFALEVSKTTGLDPRIIIAQAAQETGWGRSAPGNNYFGIKSHGQGGGNTLATTEVINGRPTRVSDSFRAYGSMGDSVRGYGDFLTRNPRYRSMLAANGLDAQIAELGRSGYATDPQYAAKVRAIANSIQLPAGGTVVGQPQTQVAQAQPGATTPDMARAGIARVDMLLNGQSRELTPQQRQSLEERRQKYVQIAEADIPVQGAQQAQGFTPPGQQQRQWDIPPERARAAIVELTRRMGHPGNTEGQRAMYKAQIDQLTPYADPMRSLDREGKTLANEKARRDLEGGQPLRQAQDRAQAAEQFGLQRGTPEYNRFVLTGQLPTDSAPTTRNIKQADGSEVVVQWDAARKDWVPLPAPEGGNAVRPQGMKLTEGQSKDLVYYNRGAQALQDFEPISQSYASGVERMASGALGGNYLNSESFQKAEQAGRNFLASILRKDTGAAITKEEEKQYGDIFLPRPGDKPGTLELKSKARKQALDAIKTGLGPAQALAIGSEALSSTQPKSGWTDVGGGYRIRAK